MREKEKFSRPRLAFLVLNMVALSAVFAWGLFVVIRDAIAAKNDSFIIEAQTGKFDGVFVSTVEVFKTDVESWVQIAYPDPKLFSVDESKTISNKPFCEAVFSSVDEKLRFVVEITNDCEHDFSVSLEKTTTFSSFNFSNVVLKEENVFGSFETIIENLETIEPFRLQSENGNLKMSFEVSIAKTLSQSEMDLLCETLFLPWNFVAENFSGTQGMEFSSNGESGSLVASCKNNSSENIVFPAFHNDEKIVEISSIDCMMAKTVELPSTINVLRAETFANCPLLEKILFNGSSEDFEKVCAQPLSAFPCEIVFSVA